MIIMTTTGGSNKNKSTREHSEAEDDDFCFPSTTCSSYHGENEMIKPPPAPAPAPAPPPPPRRKKRSSTKLIKMSHEVSAGTAAASTFSKLPKHNINVGSRRRGKAAVVGGSSVPMITRTCTECGKMFWSCKALFGHMRCHPERQWRGINPPPHFRNNNNRYIINKVNPNPTPSPSHQKNEYAYEYEEEDKEVASCLLMLANSTNTACNSSTNTNTGAGVASDTAAIRTTTMTLLPIPLVVQQQQDRYCLGGSGGWFECSSCKKVFGSHQALGGHRASHKNVKGCFAINRSTCCSHDDIMDDDDDDHHHPPPPAHHIINHDHDHQEMMASSSSTNLTNYHKCDICSRVFSSGQALGGHKRCHWERVPDHHQVMDPYFFTTHHHHVPGALDLNLPAAAVGQSPLQHQQQQLQKQQQLHGSPSSYSPDHHPAGLTLDLRLGL